MKRIPKTLQILSHTINVRIVKRQDWEALEEQYDTDIADADAMFLPGSKLIIIKKGKPSYMFQLFCHELTHAVLDAMNNDLSYDEAFVDNFAGHLAQAMKSAK